MIKKATEITCMLCVEDERELREVISEIFTVLGYEVACAENGKAGVEKAASWRPDCILMDVRMPVMNGCDGPFCMLCRCYQDLTTN